MRLPFSHSLKSFIQLALWRELLRAWFFDIARRLTICLTDVSWPGEQRCSGSGFAVKDCRFPELLVGEATWPFER